jgi:hypothetical protein
MIDDNAGLLKALLEAAKATLLAAARANDAEPRCTRLVSMAGTLGREIQILEGTRDWSDFTVRNNKSNISHKGNSKGSPFAK